MAEEEINLIEQARTAASELRAANIELKTLIERGEKIRAEDILKGTAEAGVTLPEKSTEEINIEGMKNYFKGTAVEKYIK